jgi:hypothetical protein
MPTVDKTFWFWDSQRSDTFTRKEFGDPEGTRAADAFLFVVRDGDHSYYGDTASAFYPSASDAELPVLAPRNYNDGASDNYFGPRSDIGWDTGNIISHPRFYGYLERGKTYKFHLKDSAGISKDRGSWPGEAYNSDRNKHSDLFLQTGGKSTYDSSTQYTSGLDKTGLTNDDNNGYTGTIEFTVPMDAPSILYVRGNSYRDLALPREPKNSRGERISDGLCDYTYLADWFAHNAQKGYFQVTRGGIAAVEKTGYTSSAGPFSEIKKGYNKNVFGYDKTTGGTAACKDGGGTFVVQLSDTLNRNFDISILDPTSLDSGSTITPIGYYNPSTYNNQTSHTLRQFEIGKQIFDTPDGMSSPPTDAPQVIGTQNIVVYRGHTYVFHFTGGTFGPCGPSWMNGHTVTQAPYSSRTNVLTQFSLKTTGGSDYTTNMTYYTPPTDTIDNGLHDQMLDYIRIGSEPPYNNTESNIGIIKRYIEFKLGKGIFIPDEVYTNRDTFLTLMKDALVSSGTLVWHVPAGESNSQLKIHNRTDGSSHSSDVINIADPPGGSQATHDNQNPAADDLPFPEAFFAVVNNVPTSDSDYDGMTDITEGTTLDSDGDGIKDYLDRDSDNDGIPDSAEAGGGAEIQNNPADTDSDGIPDHLDTDSDDDGISDRKESETGDSDFDGIPDYQETDSDADTIPDSVEGNIDTDHDGFPNRIDTDSDDDGIPDITEGTGDADNDGVPDYLDKADIDVGSDEVYKTIWLYDSQRTEDGLGAEKVRWAKDYRYKDTGYGQYKSFPHAFKYHVKDGDHDIGDAPNTPPLYPETHASHVSSTISEMVNKRPEAWGYDIPHYNDPTRLPNFMYDGRASSVGMSFGLNSIDFSMSNTEGFAAEETGGNGYNIHKACYAFVWNEDIYYDPSETGPLVGLDFYADIEVNNDASSNHHQSLIVQPVVYVGQGENNATVSPDLCYLPGNSANVNTLGNYSLFDGWVSRIWLWNREEVGNPPLPIGPTLPFEGLPNQLEVDNMGYIHPGGINTGSSGTTTQSIHKHYGKLPLETCNSNYASQKNYVNEMPFANRRYLYGPGFSHPSFSDLVGGNEPANQSFYPLLLGRTGKGCGSWSEPTYSSKKNPSWDIGGRLYFGFVVAFVNYKLNDEYNFSDAKTIDFSVKNFKIGTENESKADWENIQYYSVPTEPANNYKSRDNRWLTANQHYPSVPTGLYMPEPEGGTDG